MITGKNAESIEELGMSIEPIATATWCYCRLDESVDDMIQCDNASCPIIWFHLACLEIEKIPKGKWYCPECRPVTRKLVRAKSGPGGPLLAAKIGPTPDHFWEPKMVRVAKSGPAISACRKPVLALLSSYICMVCY